MKGIDMTIEQLISAVGQIATWVTVILVFFTLIEMEKQRKASQKPELIIPNISLFGYSESRDDIFIVSSWSDKKLKDDEVILEKRPYITIYNIGAGAAKEISIKWRFDIEETMKLVQDYCYRNSIPIIVSKQSDFLHIETKGRGTHINIKASLEDEHAYLMPASVTSQGLTSALPWAFLELTSILIFINIDQTQRNSGNKVVFPVEESSFEIPSMQCELSYVDIGGGRYTKKLEVPFHTVMMRYPSKETKLPTTEPVFMGRLEFKEL
jgi:hypothetical protein